MRLYECGTYVNVYMYDIDTMVHIYTHTVTHVHTYMCMCDSAVNAQCYLIPILCLNLCVFRRVYLCVCTFIYMCTHTCTQFSNRIHTTYTYTKHIQGHRQCMCPCEWISVYMPSCMYVCTKCAGVCPCVSVQVQIRICAMHKHSWTHARTCTYTHIVTCTSMFVW